jgi:pentose-5-phosphate-3-epimerase
MPEPAAKITDVKRLLAGQRDVLVHADGGVSADTAAVVGGYGVDVCIVGSALFQRGQDAANEVRAVKLNAGSAPWPS